MLAELTNKRAPNRSLRTLGSEGGTECSYLMNIDSQPSKVDEGFASIAASKLGDLARAFILKARPIVVLHNTTTNSTITIKLKRGLLKHTLYAHEDGKGDKRIDSSFSAILLIGKALNEARKLVGRGYIEI